MQKIDKILIGIAFSPNLKPNLFEAVRMANMFQADLVGVHVSEKSKEKEENIQSILQEADPLKSKFTTIWQQGKLVDVILETCKNKQIDLLILGALQQENLYQYYVGSIARKITRKALCSVLLLIKPSIVRVTCKHIVVNGLEDKKTEETIKTAFVVANYLKCKKQLLLKKLNKNIYM